MSTFQLHHHRHRSRAVHPIYPIHISLPPMQRECLTWFTPLSNGTRVRTFPGKTSLIVSGFFVRPFLGALLFLDPRLDGFPYSFAPPPMVSHDPAVSISPMDSTHPSLLYIVRTSHVIPSPMTTMSVFRLGSCSSLPAISSADTTFSRFLPQYLATSECIKRRRRFGQPWLERECPSASSRPGRWIEL